MLLHILKFLSNIIFDVKISTCIVLKQIKCSCTVYFVSNSFFSIIKILKTLILARLQYLLKLYLDIESLIVITVVNILTPPILEW